MNPKTWPTVIHIEGMDLAGKSSVASALARRGGATTRRNALALDNPYYRQADELRIRGDIGARDLGGLYIAAVRFDIANATVPQGPRIQDSTVLIRSLAYNVVRGNESTTAELIELLPAHPRFGLSIVLTASLEKRRERLAKRQREQPATVADDDRMVLQDPDRFVAMERVLMRYSMEDFDAHHIDTTSHTVGEVVDRIEELVDARKAA